MTNIELNSILLDVWLKKESKASLRSGARFKSLKKKLSRKKGITDPGAVAAAIGRKKYGKKRFQELAAQGRKHK